MLVCLCPQTHHDTSGLPWSLCRSSSDPSARAILLVQHSPIVLTSFASPFSQLFAHRVARSLFIQQYAHTHTHNTPHTHTCKPQLQPDQGSHLSKRHRQMAQNCVVGADARARNHARQRRAVALPGITKHRPARLYRCRRSEARKSGGARAAQRWEAFSLGRRQGQVQAWTLEGCLRIW